MVFFRKRRKHRIAYKDIKEVEKVMIINRIYDEKGHYRLRIKTGHRSYRFYNPAEEFEKHPDFEETGLAQLYYEFRRHGVKCC